MSTVESPAYDANGNILAYVSNTGTVTAQFEYGPFGELIRSSGTPPCNFGFSTKYRDSETGMNYYGYRYYSSGLGRWLGRDPIEEQGGLNLYGMVGNDGVNKWDLCGLSSGGCDLITVSGYNLGLGFGHASIVRWKNAPVDDSKFYSQSQLVSRGGSVVSSVEVSRSPTFSRGNFSSGWKVWERLKFPARDGTRWVLDTVGISYVVYGATAYDPNGVLFSGSEEEVDGKWSAIMNAARSYRWASQSKDSPQNFPQSIYGDPNILGVLSPLFGLRQSSYITSNNSNTFARYIASQAGLPTNFTSLIPGMSFPGNDMPQEVENRWPGQTPILNVIPRRPSN